MSGGKNTTRISHCDTCNICNTESKQLNKPFVNEKLTKDKPIVYLRLTNEERKVYTRLLNKITESSAMQNFIDFLLWKYDDVERVTLKIAWIIESNEEAAENG